MEPHQKGKSDRLREAQKRVEALEEEMEKLHEELERSRSEGRDLTPLEGKLSELSRLLHEATQSLEKALPDPHPCSERGLGRPTT